MIKGKKILFTGLDQNRNNFDELVNVGAEVIFFPTIKIIEERLSDSDLIKLKNSVNYDYIIFTSANAVTCFCSKIKNKFNEIIDSNVQIVVIGNKTKETAEHCGFKKISMPENSSSEELERYLSIEKTDNKKILIPGSKIANHKLRNSLSNKGALVDFVPVYNTIRNNDIESYVIEKVKNTLFDLIVFTSPSTFTNFVKIININKAKEYFAKTKIAVIGAVTKQAVEKYGLYVAIQPEKFNIKSLVQEIIKKF